MPQLTPPFEAATKSLAAGLFADAVRQLSPVLSPERADHCLLMAEARWRTGDLTRAAECLDHCDPAKLSVSDASRWHRIRGWVLRETGQPREGLETFRESVRIAR